MPNYDSPALGFTEHGNSLIFINNGKMPDDEWEKQLLNLLASTYDVEDLRVDFDLLHGRPVAEEVLRDTGWTTGRPKAKGKAPKTDGFPP